MIMKDIFFSKDQQIKVGKDFVVIANTFQPSVALQYSIAMTG